MDGNSARPAPATMQIGTLLLALGGNRPGRWGWPADNIAQACRALQAAGLRVTRASCLYLTEPVGGGRQPAYLNAVVMVSGAPAPGSLLRTLKRIERRAGRRPALPNSARPLDIDILDYGGRRIGWPPRRRERGRLVLPHPLLHLRTFVLVPLAEIAPHWRHPVFGRRPQAMLAQLVPKARSGVRQALDFPGYPCNKAAPQQPRSGAAVPGASGAWRSGMALRHDVRNRVRAT
jgi:2-amino-4-hydroxy-6-hydroxymethyldihydropteridine diphosphokinase